MHHRINHRVPVALLTALALTGCLNQGVGPTGGKVAMQTKVSKVQVMTKAFSLSQNQGLNKAAQSFKSLATSLQSAFGSVVMPAHATPAQAYTALRVAALRATYKTAGVSEMGSARLVFDDQTGEVTAIEGPNAKVTLDFKDDGATHTLDVAIVKSPDGTTGKLHLAVTGTWRNMSALTPPTLAVPAAPALMPKKRPPTTPPTGFGISALEEEEATATDDSASLSPDPEMTNEPATPEPTLAPVVAMPSPPPYKFAGNAVPEAVEAATLHLEITPKGDSALALKLDMNVDAPQALPGTATRVPTHAKLVAQLPKVALDWESTLTLAAGKSAFAAHGGLSVDTDNGKEAFTYESQADEATKTGSFALTNVAAKVTLLMKAAQKNPMSPPTVATTLVSAEDGSKLGDVVLDPKRPRFATVTFTDGTKMDWELYPEAMFAVPTPTAVAAR